MADPNGWGERPDGKHDHSLRDVAGGRPPWEHRRRPVIEARDRDREPNDHDLMLAEEAHWNRYGG